MDDFDELVRAIRLSFITENFVTEEDVNVVDALQNIAHGLESVANAITPSHALPSEDEAGGNVQSLTEAVMGVTASVVGTSETIDRLASDLLGSAIEDELSGASRNNAK